MNLFKGLLYLQDQTAAPEFVDDEPHYGAATAVGKFGPELGNRAASERWFGRRRGSPEVSLDDRRIASAAGCG